MKEEYKISENRCLLKRPFGRETRQTESLPANSS